MQALGQGLAARGWRLVYGGGKVGLMGTLADAAKAGGARVTGIIPESLMQREVGHHGLDELRVVPSMHVRKQQMAERADAFVALPGGLGTLEELFEVWTWRRSATTSVRWRCSTPRATTTGCWPSSKTAWTAASSPRRRPRC